ncbi:MAG: serine/threonine protein kinase, partial [Candidatus Omnitrophota bacterium]
RLRALVDPMLDKVDGIKALSAIDKLASSLTYAEKVGVKPVPRMADQSLAEIVMNILRGLGGLFNTMRGSESVGDIEGKINRAGIQRLLSNDLIDFGEVRDYLVEVRSFQMHFNTVQKQMNETINFKTILHNTENVLVKMKALKEELEKIGAQALEVERARSVAIPPEKGPVNEPLFQYPEIYFIPMVNAAIKATELFQQKLNDQIDLDGDRDSDTGSRHKPTRMTIKSPRGEIEEVSKLDSDRVFDQDIHLLKAVEYFNEEIIGNGELDDIANIQWKQIIDLFELIRGDGSLNGYDDAERALRLESIKYGRPQIAWRGAQEIFGPDVDVPLETARFYEKITSGHPDQIFVDLPGFTRVKPLSEEIVSHPASGQHRLAWFLTNYLLMRNGYAPFYINDISEYAAIPASRRMERTKLVVDIIRKQSSLTTNVESSAVDEEFSRMSDMDASYRDALGVVKKLFGDVSRHEFVDASQFKELWEQYLLGRSLIDIVQNEGRDFEQLETDQMDDDNIPGFVHVVNAEKIKLEVLYGQMDSMSTSDDLMNDRDFFIGAEGLLPVIMRLLNSLADKLKSLPFVYMYHLNPEEAIQLYVGDEPAQVRIGEYKFEIQLTSDASQEISVSLVNSKNLGFLRNEPYLLGPGQAIEIDSNISGVNLHIIDVDHQVLDSIHTEIRSPQSRRSQTRILNMNEEGSLIVEVQNTNGRDEDTLTIDEVHAAKVLFKGDLTIDGDYQFKAQRIEAEFQRVNEAKPLIIVGSSDGAESQQFTLVERWGKKEQDFVILLKTNADDSTEYVLADWNEYRYNHKVKLLPGIGIDSETNRAYTRDSVGEHKNFNAQTLSISARLELWADATRMTNMETVVIDVADESGRAEWDEKLVVLDSEFGLNPRAEYGELELGLARRFEEFISGRDFFDDIDLPDSSSFFKFVGEPFDRKIILKMIDAMKSDNSPNFEEIFTELERKGGSEYVNTHGIEMENKPHSMFNVSGYWDDVDLSVEAKLIHSLNHLVTGDSSAYAEYRQFISQLQGLSLDKRVKIEVELKRIGGVKQRLVAWFLMHQYPYATHLNLYHRSRNLDHFTGSQHEFKDPTFFGIEPEYPAIYLEETLDGEVSGQVIKAIIPIDSLISFNFGRREAEELVVQEGIYEISIQTTIGGGRMASLQEELAEKFDDSDVAVWYASYAGTKETVEYANAAFATVFGSSVEAILDNPTYVEINETGADIREYKIQDAEAMRVGVFIDRSDGSGISVVKIKFGDGVLGIFVPTILTTDKSSYGGLEPELVKALELAAPEFLESGLIDALMRPIVEYSPTDEDLTSGRVAEILAERLEESLERGEQLILNTPYLDYEILEQYGDNTFRAQRISPDAIGINENTILKVLDEPDTWEQKFTTFKQLKEARQLAFERHDQTALRMLPEFIHLNREFGLAETVFIDGTRLDKLEGLVETHEEDYGIEIDEERLKFQYVFQFAADLAYMHQTYKLFHNDISESNIMIGKNHELRLIDFDEARIYTDSKERLVKMRNVGKYWDIVQVATLIAQLYSRSYEPEFETRLKQPGQEIDIAEYIASREHVDKRFDEGKVPPTFLEALLKATLQHPTEHYESLGQFVTDLQKALLKKYPRGSLGSAGRMAPLRDRDTSDDALGLRRIRAEQRKTRNLFNVNALMGGSRVMREFNILNHESDLEEYAYSGTWDEIVEQYQQDKPKFVDNKKIYISSELKAEDRVHSVVAILDSVSMADEVTALSVLRGIYNTSSPADFQMHIIQDQGIRNIHFKMIQFGQSTDTKPLLGKSLMRSVFLNMHDIIKTAFGREAGRWTMSGVVHNPKVQAFFEEFPRTNDASSDVTQVIQRYEPEFREDGPVAWLGYIGESPGGSQAPTPTAPRMTPIDMAWLDDGGMREKIAEIRKTSKEIFGGDWSKAGAYLKGGRAPVGGFAAKELLLFYIIASEDLLNTGFNSRDFQVNGVPVIDLMGRNIEVILTQLVPQARRIPNKETSQFRTFQLRSNGLEFATDALKRYEQSLGESVFAGDPVLSIAEAIKDLFGLTQSTNIRFLKPMLNDGERLDVLAYVIAFYRRHKTTPTITAITQYFETSMRKPLNAVSNLSRDLGLAFPSIGNGWQAGHGNAPILTVPKAEVIAIRRFISAKAIAGAEPKPLSTLSADHKRLIGAYYGSKINTRPYEIIVYILSYYTDHQEMPSLTEVAKHLMLPDSRDVKTSLAAINGVLTQLNVAPLKLVRKANSYQQDVRLQTISATRQKFEPKARMAIMNYAEMLPKLYSNDVVKARQLAGLFAGAQWEGGSNLQRLMSRSGLKLLEKTEFGTKRFFDQNGRWIMTVDPFGNKIDALVWGDDGQFIKAWTRNENGQGVVLSKNPANGLATVVRLEKFDGDIFSFSPGIDFNNLSKIPYAVFNPDMNLSARTVDQSRGVAISVLRLMSHIAKDQGNTLVYEFDDEINYPIPSDRLYGSLLEVADVPTRFIRVAQTAGLRDYGVDETPDYVLTPERRSFRKFPQAFFWNPNPPERAFNPTTKTFVSYRDGQVERVYYGDDTYVHFEFEMGKLRERNYYVEKEGNNTFRLSGNLDALIDWYGNFIKDAGGVSDENNYVSRMSTQLLESPLPSKRAEKLTGLDETHIALASPYVDRMSYIASSSDATGLVAFKGNRIFNPDGSERVVNASRARLEELRQKNMRPRAVESNLSAIQFKRKLTQSIANYSLGSTLLDKLIQVVNGPFEIINDVESFVNALPSNLSMLYALQKDEHFSGGLINQIFVGGKKESEALDAYKKQLLAGDAEVGFGTFVDGIQIISMDEALGSLKGQKAVFAGTAKAFGQYYSQEKFGDLVDQGHIAITPTHAARPGQAIDSLNQLISGALLSAWQRLEPEDRVAYADDMGHYFRNTYNIRKSHEIDDLAESSHGQLEWYEDVSLPVLGEFDWTTFMQLQPKLRRATQASA